MDKLFISILNNALVASWIILAVIALRMLFKKTPKWINCLMWVLVAIKLVIPFRIESIFSLIPTANPVPADIEYSEVPRIDTGFATVNTVINPVLESNFSATETASANPMQVIIGIAAIVWIWGVALLIIYGLTSFILLRKKVKDATPASESIYKCDTIESPFIFGIIKPHIFVPETLNECDYACVIEHEKAHIQRRDYIWKPMGFAILAVYWFNPLCWVAYILLCKDIEYACDEKVTKDKDKEWKAKYCQALLNCSSQRRLVSACPVAFGEVSVKERIKSVINYKKPALWIAVFAIIGCVLVGVFFLTNPKAESTGNDEFIVDESLNDVNKREKLAQYLEDVIAEDFLNEYDFDSISVEVEPLDNDGFSGVMKIRSSNVVENDFGAICSGYLDKYLKAYSAYFNESLITKRNVSGEKVTRNEIDDTNQNKPLWGIVINADNVTSQGCVITVHQDGTEIIGYINIGSKYELDYWDDELGWTSLDEIPSDYVRTWTDMAYAIEQGSTNSWKVNWEDLYGNIAVGKYRIKKEVMLVRGPGDYDKAICCAYFEINMDSAELSDAKREAIEEQLELEKKIQEEQSALMEKYKAYKNSLKDR